MSPIKIGCIFCPPDCKKMPPDEGRDSEMHPSWSAGMQALDDYNHWVNAIVLPIAFQWIEEHKAEVYADVPQELRDDMGVAIATAFKLVKELPTYKLGRQKSAAHEASRAAGTADLSGTNPVWTGITKTMRAKTKEVFEAHGEHLGETIP